MGSLYKRCPFRKGYCNDSCALFDVENRAVGCVFLDIGKSLHYVVNDLFYVKEYVKQALIEKKRENEEEDW